MSYFTEDNRTRNFLIRCGIEPKYSPSLEFSKLVPGWQNVNDGRPENQHRVPEAVESYATRMIEGSQAPAVIIRNGEVLDGIQRLLAASEFCDATHFGAYVVECDDYSAQKIRKASNTLINGSAVVNPEFTLREIVRLCCIMHGESVKEVANFLGRSASQVQKEFARQRAADFVKPSRVLTELGSLATTTPMPPLSPIGR